ncbi:MAG: MATE family efflux transporter [Clostridia bacterium]|nr:MATE family efflux transporter [Clostridia bacterium]
MIDGIFKKLSNIQIVVSITASISMIVDGAFIGRSLGMDGVAAAGLITPVLMIILAFSGVLSAGGQLIVGRKMGSGDRDAAIGAMSVCFFMAVFSGLFLTGLVFAFTNPICMLLGARPGSKLLAMSGQYLRGYVLGNAGIIGVLSMVPLLNLDGDKKRSFAAAWIITMTDIVLDIAAVLVFPGQIFAIALATSISYLVGFMVMCGHFAKNDRHFMLKIRLKNLPWRDGIQMLVLGLPAALQKALRTLLSFTVNHILLAVGGPVALAGFSIVSQIGNLLNSVGQGLSAATLTIAGVMHGEKIKKNLRDLYRAFIKYSVWWNLVVAAIGIIGADVLVSIFMSAKKVDVSAVVMGVRIFSLDFVFYSLCLCAKSYYQGIKRMSVNYLITIVEGYGCIAFFTFVLGHFFGFYGVCLGYGLGDAVSLLSIAAGVWMTKKRFPKRLDDYLLLQEDEMIPEDRVYHVDVTGPEDIGRISRESAAFMQQHLRTRESIADMETLLMPLMLQGFPNTKKPAAEISLICQDTAAVLLVSDNCTGFSLVDAISKEKIPSAVQEMEHYQVLGINKTKIRLH